MVASGSLHQELDHKRKHAAEAQALNANSPVNLEVHGELFDVRATFKIGDAKKVGLDIGGNVVSYDVPGQKLQGATLKPVEGQVSVQVLVDRPMVNGLLMALPVAIVASEARRQLAGSVAEVVSTSVRLYD